MSSNNNDLIATDSPKLNRRMAMRALAAMGVGPAALGAYAESEPSSDADDGTGTLKMLQRPGAKPAGTATDPDLRNPVVPWPRTLGKDQLATLQVLCDLILPADDRSPAASVLGCHEFIDEWVSAPYPDQQAHGALLVAGLKWLADESQARFSQGDFTKLAVTDQRAICDDICVAVAPKPELETGVAFFTLVRNLTCGAFFTTQTGMDDIGYVGNRPQASWGLPPKAVLAHLGLDKPD